MKITGVIRVRIYIYVYIYKLLNTTYNSYSFYYICILCYNFLLYSLIFGYPMRHKNT